MCSERQILSQLTECNCVQAVIESGSVCQLCPLQKQHQLPSRMLSKPEISFHLFLSDGKTEVNLLILLITDTNDKSQ